MLNTQGLLSQYKCSLCRQKQLRIACRLILLDNLIVQRIGFQKRHIRLLYPAPCLGAGVNLPTSLRKEFEIGERPCVQFRLARNQGHRLTVPAVSQLAVSVKKIGMPQIDGRRHGLAQLHGPHTSCSCLPPLTKLDTGPAEIVPGAPPLRRQRDATFIGDYGLFSATQPVQHVPAQGPQPCVSRAGLQRRIDERQGAVPILRADRLFDCGTPVARSWDRRCSLGRRLLRQSRQGKQ